MHLNQAHFVHSAATVAQLLPDDLEVIPLDNSAQGIYTIGDIRKAIDDNGA